MRRRFFASITIFAALAFTAAAADLTGKWVGQIEGRNGAQQITFDLKADGAKVTGTVTGGGGGRGGGGGTPAAQEISDGKIDGDKVSFTVKVDNNGQTRVTTYTG